MGSDINVKVQWDGSTLRFIAEKPLTQDQYDALKLSPNTLAHLVFERAAHDLLMLKCPRIEIEEIEKATT